MAEDHTDRESAAEQHARLQREIERLNAREREYDGFHYGVESRAERVEQVARSIAYPTSPFNDAVYRAMYRYEARKAVAALFEREGWTVREGDAR